MGMLMAMTMAKLREEEAKNLQAEPPQETIQVPKPKPVEHRKPAQRRNAKRK